jgi:hypothetical protein
MRRRLSGLRMVIDRLPCDEDFDSANLHPPKSPEICELLTPDSYSSCSGSSRKEFSV